jgi:hypothetical protein
MIFNFEKQNNGNTNSKFGDSINHKINSEPKHCLPLTLFFFKCSELTFLVRETLSMDETENSSRVNFQRPVSVKVLVFSLLKQSNSHRFWNWEFQVTKNFSIILCTGI